MTGPGVIAVLLRQRVSAGAILSPAAASFTAELTAAIPPETPVPWPGVPAARPVRHRKHVLLADPGPAAADLPRDLQLLALRRILAIGLIVGEIPPRRTLPAPRRTGGPLPDGMPRLPAGRPGRVAAFALIPGRTGQQALAKQAAEPAGLIL